jgi:O-antigen ligase
LNLQLLVGPVRNRLLEAGRWSVLLCLFSVPINKPATNIFIFFALVCAILGERTKQRFDAALKQPVVAGALIWLVILLISTLLAPAGNERWEALGIYRALFYPLIVAALLETQKWRTRGLIAFGTSAGLILLISWIRFLWSLHDSDPATISGMESYTVFKNYTQQGVTFVVLAALAAAFADAATDRKRKWLLWLVAGAAFANVIFLLQSRTAYLVAAPFLLYWIWRAVVGRHPNWRGIATGLLILASVGTAASLTPRVQQRIAQINSDYANYNDKRDATSLGVRLELWKRTMPIIASAPVLGHGLGQWRPQYQAQIAGDPVREGFQMGHPHQEALLILSEQGIVGFIAFLMALILLARYIRRLDPPHRDFYMVLLLIYIMAGLVNCVLADFGHRHVFLMLLACIPYAAGAAGQGRTKA